MAAARAAGNDRRTYHALAGGSGESPLATATPQFCVQSARSSVPPRLSSNACNEAIAFCRSNRNSKLSRTIGAATCAPKPPCSMIARRGVARSYRRGERDEQRVIAHFPGRLSFDARRRCSLGHRDAAHLRSPGLARHLDIGEGQLGAGGSPVVDHASHCGMDEIEMVLDRCRADICGTIFCP